jgi:hypothetical protein
MPAYAGLVLPLVTTRGLASSLESCTKLRKLSLSAAAQLADSAPQLAEAECAAILSLPEAAGAADEPLVEAGAVQRSASPAVKPAAAESAAGAASGRPVCSISACAGRID